MIETKRLYLRPVQLSDAIDMYEYASDAETVRYVLFETHPSLEHTSEVITELFLSKKANNQPESFALVLKTTGKMIGTCDFFQVNRDNFEMGYILNKQYWNQGYMTEVAQQVMAIAFNEYHVRRLEIRHLAPNIASQKIIEKLGFRYEGLKKQEYRDKDGKYCDVLYYALLKEEYDANVSQKI